MTQEREKKRERFVPGALEKQCILKIFTSEFNDPFSAIQDAPLYLVDFKPVYTTAITKISTLFKSPSSTLNIL